MENKRPLRKALLIGAPGGINSNYLHGVPVDLENMFHFLKSPSGGSWYESEIKVIAKASSIDVMLALANIEAEYAYVFFSGHGYTNKHTGQRMLCLQDTDIGDKSFLSSRLSKQLVVIDACRNYVSPGIGALPPTRGEPDYFAGAPPSAREIFDNYIKTSPPGKIIVHGTQTGLPSNDSRFGGYFTQALLEVGINIKSGKEYSAYSIHSLLRHVPQILRQHNNRQIPSIPYQIGNMRIPFAIEIPRPSIQIHQREVAQRSIDPDWSGTALFTLLILILGSALDG
jgi:hypothetical protein